MTGDRRRSPASGPTHIYPSLPLLPNCIHAPRHTLSYLSYPNSCYRQLLSRLWQGAPRCRLRGDGVRQPRRQCRSALGRALGPKYEVRRMLGQGGFAEVYEVWDKDLQRRLAVKVY